MSPEFSRTEPLLDDESRNKLPPIYSQQRKGLDAVAQVKFFISGRSWTWYATEGSPKDADGNFDTDKPEVDFFFFGLIVGPEIEINFFPRSILESVRRAGLPIQRDLNFEPKTLGEIQADLRAKGLL